LAKKVNNFKLVITTNMIRYNKINNNYNNKLCNRHNNYNINHNSKTLTQNPRKNRLSLSWNKTFNNNNYNNNNYKKLIISHLKINKNHKKITIKWIKWTNKIIHNNNNNNNLKIFSWKTVNKIYKTNKTNNSKILRAKVKLSNSLYYKKEILYKNSNNFKINRCSKYNRFHNKTNQCHNKIFLKIINKLIKQSIWKISKAKNSSLRKKWKKKNNNSNNNNNSKCKWNRCHKINRRMLTKWT
jgi:hypothetical protein